MRLLAIVLLLGVAALAPAIALAATHQVTAQSSPYVFVASQLTVRVGDTVTWTMGPGDPHTVTSGTYNASGVHPDGLFDSNTLQAGETFSFTFTTAGEIPYVCEIHADSGMVGRIVVQAAATPPPTPAPAPTPPPTPVPTVTPPPPATPAPAATEASGDPPTTSPTVGPSPTTAALASSGSSPDASPDAGPGPVDGQPGNDDDGGGGPLAIAVLLGVALAVGVVGRMILARRGHG